MEITKKKVAFYTLGCKLNFAETSTISRSFPEDKFEKVNTGSISMLLIHVQLPRLQTGNAVR
jgi:threonylcarbamoyladenosine tRNA methylthiotransferase MtaB